MVPTIAEILLTIRVVAECIMKVIEYLMTDDGKALVQQLAKDRATWDKTWASVGNWFQAFFAGELLKAKT